jgi:hypothetical protein
VAFVLRQNGAGFFAGNDLCCSYSLQNQPVGFSFPGAADPSPIWYAFCTFPPSLQSSSRDISRERRSFHRQRTVHDIFFLQH